MNLSPGRLAVLVALVVGGVAVMMNGFGDEGATLASGPSDAIQTSSTETPGPTDETSAPATETTPPPLEPRVEDVVVQVLNGTDATGLAGQVDLLLEGKGYSMDTTEPGDLESKPVLGTTVYFRAESDSEQNEVDAENLAKYLKGVEARVRPLNNALSDEGALDPAAQLVVVLGDDYAAAHPVT